MDKNNVNKYKLYDFNKKNLLYLSVYGIISIFLTKPYFDIVTKQILNGSDSDIVLLKQLPALFGVFALIPGAILLESVKNKDKATGILLVLSKIMYLVIFFLLFFNFDGISTIFVIAVGLMNAPTSVVTIGYQSKIGELFSATERKDALIMRENGRSIAKIFTAVLTTGIIYFTETDSSLRIILQGFFLLSFVFGMFEVYTFFKFKTPTEQHIKIEKKKIKFKRIVKRLKYDKKFSSYLIASGIMYLGWTMCWPLFSLYKLNVLGFTSGLYGIESLIASTFGIISMPFWRKLSLNYGNNIVFSIASLFMALTPIFYIVSSHPIHLLLLTPIMGMGSSGTLYVFFNMIIDVTPKANRAIFISIYTVFTLLLEFLGPGISGIIIEYFNITTGLFIGAIMRFLGSLSLFIRHKFFNKKSI